MSEPYLKTLSIQGRITIERAQELKELLLSRISAADNLLIDLNDMTEIDVTGLQLLCAAHKHALKTGRMIHLKTPLPAKLADAIRLSGFVRQQSCVSIRGIECIFKDLEKKRIVP